MGHFSHTCKLSNIPITGGTKVMLFLLKMRDHWYEYSEDNLRRYGTTYQCSNDATTSRFIPFAFPIRGEYDDYGGITNIERDENVEFLEEYFGLDIDTIMKVITSCRKDTGYGDELDVVKDLEASKYPNPVYKEEFKELLSLSGMWVHQEFHDNLVKSYKHNEYDRIDMGTPALLKSLGFEFMGEDETKGRFNQKFQKGNCIVYSDGNWLDGGIYLLRNLKKYCQEQGEDIDITEAVAKTKSQQIYDYLLPEVREKVIELEDLETKEASIEDYKQYYRQLHELRDDREVAKVCKIFDKNGSWDRATDLGKKYILAAVDGKFRKHVNELAIFDHAMYVCGKYYDVTGTSPQDGDLMGVHWVLKTALDTITPAVEEWIGEYGDEEED